MLFAVILFLFHGKPLEVGDGKPFARIEDAVKVAQAGDEIDVYPKAAGYSKTAVLVRTPRLTIFGIAKKIQLDGADFEYSGVGSVPRAIFQVDPGADGVTIDNFELRGAHSRSHNGAGVRINQASRVTIRNCDIHDNDMGVMSNGIDGNPHAAENQLIDSCTISRNGNTADPGFNHNLYLGGTSATVTHCTIFHALTGHNLKSRAHYTVVECCIISGSANRELDFVDAWDTRRPNSNALVFGNIIEKDPDCNGNRTVINFGQENGHRDGTLFLINNTIKTPFQSAVLGLSGPAVSARFKNNLVENYSQTHPVLIEATKGAVLSNVRGGYNVISPAYEIVGTGIDIKTLYTDPRRRQLPGKDRPPLPFPPGPTSYKDGNGVEGVYLVSYVHSPTKGWIPNKSVPGGYEIPPVRPVPPPQIGAGD